MKRDPKNFDEMWGNIRMLSIIFFIITPLIYLIVAYLEEEVPMTGGEHDMMFYMLLIVAVFIPLLLPLITKSQVRGFKNRSKSIMSKFQFVQSLFIQRAAIVTSCYVLGLAVFFVSHDFQRLYCFYPIGIAWTFIYWPRGARYEALINELELS